MGKELQAEADKMDDMADGTCPDDYMSCDLYSDGIPETICAPSVCKPINILKEGLESEGPDVDLAVECDGHDRVTPADIPADEMPGGAGDESNGNEGNASNESNASNDTVVEDDQEEDE